jgi:hypothetical protein
MAVLVELKFIGVFLLGLVKLKSDYKNVE